MATDPRADPLAALRLPLESIEPRAEFAAELRRRLEGELMSSTTTRITGPAHVPPRMRAVNAYLAVSDARAAIDWYKEIFGAVETMEPIVMDDGRVGHAEFQIGDVVMMISDEFPDLNVLGPNARGGSTTAFVIYVPDVDVTFAAALGAGAIQDRPVEDQFHGSRAGWLRDPWGHRWNVATPMADR